MTRADILKAMDGEHPRIGQAISLSLSVFILISAVCIAVETIQDLPDWASTTLRFFERMVLLVFTVEYLLRVICAPRPLRYIFSFWGVVDLIACLPVLALLNTKWAAVRVLRLARLMRLLKLMRSSRALAKLQAVLESVKGDLLVFACLASLVLYIAAVGIYIFEHEAQPVAFGSIPDAFWWAIVSFTTVGYGDSYPITPGGKMFTAAILFIGMGVIAVPAAVITSALIEQTRHEREKKERHETPHSRPHRHLHRPRHRRNERGPGPRPG